ncbi:TonB-dependent siderophore receptor, partial [Stenotrophomonas sp. HMWF003]
GQLSDALAGLQLSMTYTWTEATARAGVFAGRDLPLYSRQVGSFGARYAIDRWTFNADLFAQSGQRSPGTPTEGAAYVTAEDPTGRLGDIPGYSTLAVRAGYDFGPALHDLKLAIGVKNVLDRRYYTRSTDNNGGKFVGQPRTVYLQGTIGF